MKPDQIELKKTKVRYVTGYNDDGSEIWSQDTKTVVEYGDNTCGDGCCDGFILRGMPNEIFWAGQLQVVE